MLRSRHKHHQLQVILLATDIHQSQLDQVLQDDFLESVYIFCHIDRHRLDSIALNQPDMLFEMELVLSGMNQLIFHQLLHFERKEAVITFN